MMNTKNNLIFSIYVTGQNFRRQYRNDNQKYYTQFKDRLKANKIDYASACEDTEFILMENDDRFLKWRSKLQMHPFLDHFDIVNLYKFYLLEVFAPMYENVLFMDFDMVWTNSFVDVFKHYDFSDGIVIRELMFPQCSLADVVHVNADQHREHWTDHLKSWLSYEVLDEKGVTVNRLNDMHYYNTSFIGGTEKHIKQLNYFGDIDLELSMLSSMYKKEDVSKYLYFSDTGEDKIGYDNETIFTIKAIESGVNIQPMSKDFSSFTHVYRKKRFGDYL